MLAAFLKFVIEALIFLIFVRVVLSWLPDLRRRFWDFSNLVTQITEPILAPIRNLLPPQKMGGLDLSPLIAIFALQLLESLVVPIFHLLFVR